MQLVFVVAMPAHQGRRVAVFQVAQAACHFRRLVAEQRMAVDAVLEFRLALAHVGNHGGHGTTVLWQP